MQFEKPCAKLADRLARYYGLRPNKTCDSVPLDTFLWRDYYHAAYAELEDKALLLRMHDGKEYFTAMPYCAPEDLGYCFEKLQEFFNRELKKPLKIYLADQEAVTALGLQENPDYLVAEEEDLKDYLYDGDELRLLAGKKFQKKRNLVSKFEREYEGRWEYTNFGCAGKVVLAQFIDDWFTARIAESPEEEKTLTYEMNGILYVLNNCEELDFRVGGLLIDGKVVGFSIGAYNAREEMAVISVEKALNDIPGVYQALNQQFLLHEFPDAKIINREDDMGLPGLRRAKESYNPIGFERKYMVVQLGFEGSEEALVDFYEAEIEERNQED